MPGRIVAEDLPALYSAACALVYVPLYEGFGLPPLEAMQCGCPIVTSNNSSVPEVVGDAALLVDPEDERQIAEAMLRVATDEPLCEELRTKGVCRAKQFSWTQCAADTVAAYERALAA
jgi:glycosyltransferase involved in cell wall biosynthesis